MKGSHSLYRPFWACPQSAERHGARPEVRVKLLPENKELYVYVESQARILCRTLISRQIAMTTRLKLRNRSIAWILLLAH